ncbi:hypothetical protein CPAR01_10183 [Colletotrichum paranaense]|uniref:Uncharacterized protein n=2 Tax=Colletotrichum acutatum species complex TaxID=2707335 RepID=A0ABQ9SD91_9PEZI|nr:uncharacterized protein CPAR01_10183 [Colletotrichum paranaense]XP_060379755.1 uncharacterized protein CTAM01_09669 [Colletotrichum tamarilloi]KAK1493042.1 hypothetical protein CTAM01_09669 [Colletotrichum tamarilloi]KAK1533475.1 hypothetical protein CPAR01_10183 [Colletotrichum paranaense]
MPALCSGRGGPEHAPFTLRIPMSPSTYRCVESSRRRTRTLLRMLQPKQACFCPLL